MFKQTFGAIFTRLPLPAVSCFCLEMNHDLHQSTDSIGVWSDSEPQDSSTFSTDMENSHAVCTPLTPLSADAVSLAPRSMGITGALSLHDYRRQLASTEYFDDPVDRQDKTLKRKPANLNLKHLPALTAFPPYAASIASSRASSPPPLSPSYSQSVVSQRSEQDDAFDLPSGMAS